MVDSVVGRNDRVIGSVDSVAEIGADGGLCVSIRRGALAVVRGWALHEGLSEAVDSLHVFLGSNTAAVAILGLPRPDVAARFGRASLNAGFTAVFPIMLPPADYRLSFEARKQNKVLRWDTDIAVTVDAPKDPFAGRSERKDRWAFAIDGLFQSDGTFLTAVDGTAAMPWNCPAFIKLWVIDLAARAPAQRVVARAGELELPVLDGLTRADAASAVAVLPAVRCGFAVPVPPLLSDTEQIELFALGENETFIRLGEVRVATSRPVSLTALPLGESIVGKIDAVTVDGIEMDPAAEIAVTAASALSVRGWAVGETGPRRCGGVFAVVEGGGTYVALYGGMRPDIAAALDAPDIAACEFEVAIDASLLGPGSHRISIIALTARGDARGSLEQSIVVNVEAVERQ